MESRKWKVEHEMKYKEWQAGIPDDIKGDPLWRLEVYRLSLFLSDIAWQDVLTLDRTHLTKGLADQLYRAACSISANIAEGYSRSTGSDRARFLEYALGSARETRDWYYKARHIFTEEVVKHRIALLTQLIKMLNILTPLQRQKGIRESETSYVAVSQAADWNLDSEIPEP